MAGLLVPRRVDRRADCLVAAVKAITKTIVVSCGRIRLLVPATVFGDWAAHVSLHLGDDCGTDRWRVTHVPSGCDIANLADGLSRRDALSVACALGERLPSLKIRRLAVTSPRMDPEIAEIARAIVGEALDDC